MPVHSSDLLNHPVSGEPEPWQTFRREDMEMQMLSRLNAARVAVAEGMRPYLAKHLLSEIDWWVLRTLHIHPRVSHATLHNYTRIPKPTLSRAIDWLRECDLVRKVYARRNGAPKNKRTLYGEGRSIHRTLHYQLELTPGGEYVCREIMASAAERTRAAERTFSEDDLLELYGLLRRFTEALSGVSWEATYRPHDPYAKKTKRIVEIAKTWPRGPDGKILPRSGVARPRKRRSLTKRDLDRIAGVDYPRRSHHKKKPEVSGGLANPPLPDPLLPHAPSRAADRATEGEAE